MRNRLPRGLFALLTGLAVAGPFATGPAFAQVFDFDNVVLLANEDRYSGYNDVWGFVGTDGREYVIQGTTTGTAWWDIDDPTNPVHVKFIPGPGSIWRDMFVIGDYAYIGTEGGGGIQIVDISDPTDPTLVNTYTATVGACHNVFGDPSRNLLFVVGGYTTNVNGGVQIFDATDPVNLVEIGEWDTKYIHDLSVEGNLLYAALISDSRMRILDATDPTNPVNYGTVYFDPVQATHATWPLGDGQHVMIVQETNGGRLDKLDVSVPTAIVRVASHNPAPAASPHNVHVQGDRIYVSWYARGTRIFDPDLNELGYWDTYPDTDGGGVGPGNWGVYPHLPSGVIAANDGKYGLFLLQYEPDAGILDGTVSSSGGSFVEEPTVELVDLTLEQRAVSYKFSAFPGPAQLRFSAFGHVEQTLPVSVIADNTTTTNVVLDKLPSGSLSGTVTEEGSGLPIEDVDVIVAGTPLEAKTDASGAFAFPDVPSGSYTVEFARYGYEVPADRNVSVQTGQAAVENLELTPAFEYEDFAAPAGWTVQSDPSTTSGFWVFDEPYGTYSAGIPFQTEFDHTLDPEDQCAVTGNASNGSIGGDDVDGGATRLFSPVYDLSGMSEPHAFYYRWYAVNSNVDEWQVHVTTNGGASWTLIDSTPDHEPFWQKKDIDISAIAAGQSAVQFRFTAEDPDPGQVVEAALDDFTLYDAGGGATPVALPEKAFGLELAQNFPNPFPSRTRIDFAVPSREHVHISVFDVRGARVATIVDEPLEAGRHSAEWDGRTFSGSQAAAGVYFYKLQTKDEIRTRKMIRVN
jgi:choice-of-anchor B domain-containing protein